MLPEQSKRGRPSVACANCRAARRACDGKFADCAKYVSLPATASDAAGPSQPASPPPSRPVRSKVSPGGSEHRGAPVALAAEPAYSPDEKMRDYTDRRYDLKQRRTSEEAVVAVGEQLASAGWAADAVIEEDGRTRSGQLDSKQAGGRLMELLVVAFASVSPDAPLSLQLEQVAGSLGQAAAAAEAEGGERRASRRQAGMQPPAAAAAAAASEPLPGKALGKRKAGTAEPQADGAGGKNPAAPAARRGRPPALAASGAASMDAVRAISAQAHGAPRKAKAAFDAQLEAAEGASSAGTRVAASSRLRLSPLALGHSSGFARAGGGEFAAAAGATADPVGARLVRQSAAAGVGRRRRHLDPRLPRISWHKYFLFELYKISKSVSFLYRLIRTKCYQLSSHVLNYC